METLHAHTVSRHNTSTFQRSTECTVHFHFGLKFVVTSGHRDLAVQYNRETPTQGMRPKCVQWGEARRSTRGCMGEISCRAKRVGSKSNVKMRVRPLAAKLHHIRITIMYTKQFECPANSSFIVKMCL